MDFTKNVKNVGFERRLLNLEKDSVRRKLDKDFELANNGKLFDFQVEDIYDLKEKDISDFQKRMLENKTGI